MARVELARGGAPWWFVGVVGVDSPKNGMVGCGEPADLLISLLRCRVARGERGASIWCEGPWGVLCGSDVVVVAVDLEVELGVRAGARCRCWQRVEPALWGQKG